MKSSQALETTCWNICLIFKKYCHWFLTHFLSRQTCLIVNYLFCDINLLWYNYNNFYLCNKNFFWVGGQWNHIFYSPKNACMYACINSYVETLIVFIFCRNSLDNRSPMSRVVEGCRSPGLHARATCGYAALVNPCQCTGHSRPITDLFNKTA